MLNEGKHLADTQRVFSEMFHFVQHNMDSH
jgi:hypothetical protein